MASLLWQLPEQNPDKESQTWRLSRLHLWSGVGDATPHRSGNDASEVLAGMDVRIVEEDGHIQTFRVHFLNHGSCRSVEGPGFRSSGLGFWV